MDEQALNKKLVEWAGLCNHEFETSSDAMFGFLEDKCKKCGQVLYTYEDKTWTPAIGSSLPDFTQSLDACFKWLVPEAIGKIMAMHQCSSDLAYALLFKWWLQELELIIPEAALALCLAIEKLIDMEVEEVTM